MASLQGNIEDFGMADIFQLIAQQRKTGVLEFRGNGKTIEILFDNGFVVSAGHAGSYEAEYLGQMLLRCGVLTRERFDDFEAEVKRTCQSMAKLVVEKAILSPPEVREIEDLITQDTLFELLRWSEGAFHFQTVAVKHKRQRAELIPTDHILMDGLRMVDEWHQFTSMVPDDRMIFGKVDDSEDSERGLSADIRKIYRRIDGRLSVRRIIDLSRLGTFEGTRIFADLRNQALIEPVEVEEPKRETKKWSKLRLNRGIAPILATTLLAMVLLGGLTFYAVNLSRATALEAFTVRRAPLNETQIYLETLLLRNAIETYRYAEPFRGGERGDQEFPETLEELVEREYVESDALVGPNGAQYYYVVRGGSFLLLAPEF